MNFLGFDISPEKYEYLINIPKEKLLGWVEAGLSILPNFAVAIITLMLFYPIAKGAKFLAGKIYRKNNDNLAVHGLFTSLVFLIVFLIGVFSALEILNLEKTVTSLLAGAGVIGLAIGFAFQEIASNFVSGVMISFRKPYRIGDRVEIQGKRGIVQAIDLRTTSIMTGQGLEIIVPNKIMMTDMLINYTSTPDRCVEIIVGVSYDADLEKAAEVAKKAVEGISSRVKEKAVDVNYQLFGDSAIHCKVSFWVPNNDFDHATHEAIINIKQAFDKNKITIPFPTRTIIKGL